MLKKWIVLLFSTLFMLVACHSPLYNQTMGNVADVKLKMADDLKKSNEDAVVEPSLLVRKGVYVDRKPINLVSDPTWLHTKIVIRGDQLPFSYYTRVIAAGAGADHILSKYQAGLDQSVSLSLSYAGPIKGALDLIASKTGYVYSIQNNRIYWQAFVTRTFDVAFMPGSSDYLMGAKSGSAASTSSQGSQAQVSNYVNTDQSQSEYSNLSAKLSLWSDLDATVRQLLSPDGQVTVSQATTTVTVRDRPTNVDLVGQYINNLNGKLSKQVLIKVQVLEVALSNEYNWGINWNLVVKAFHNSPFIINGNYGTPVAITPLSPQPAVAGGFTAPIFGLNSFRDPSAGTEIPSYTILLNALNQQGKTSVVTEPRVVCLNNQVSAIKIVDTQGYVASIQNTTLPGSTSSSGANVSTVTSQVTPGSVITGLTLYILPKILNDKIYMQVNADLSTFNGFDALSGIQLPKITEKHFNQKSVITSGTTMILSGMKQTTNIANANQFATSQALGGKGARQLNKETIILITPIILNSNLVSSINLNGAG